MPKYTPKREENVEAWELVESIDMVTSTGDCGNKYKGNTGDFMVRLPDGRFIIMEREKFLAKYDAVASTKRGIEIDPEDLKEIFDKAKKEAEKNPWINPQPMRPYRRPMLPGPVVGDPYKRPQIWCENQTTKLHPIEGVQ